MLKPWCVYCKPSLTLPDSVLNYLNRYTQKGMLHESRLTSISDEGVSFKYKDYRQSNSPRTMRLNGVEFLRQAKQIAEPMSKLKPITEFSWPCPECEVGVLRLCGLNLPKPNVFKAIERFSSG